MILKNQGTFVPLGLHTTFGGRIHRSCLTNQGPLFHKKLRGMNRGEINWSSIFLGATLTFRVTGMISFEWHLMAPQQNHALQRRSAFTVGYPMRRKDAQSGSKSWHKQISGGRKKLITCKFFLLFFTSRTANNEESACRVPCESISPPRHAKLEECVWRLSVIYLKVFVTCSNSAAYVRTLLLM
jgi:hypothetical protein